MITPRFPALSLGVLGLLASGCLTPEFDFNYDEFVEAGDEDSAGGGAPSREDLSTGGGGDSLGGSGPSAEGGQNSGGNGSGGDGSGSGGSAAGGSASGGSGSGGDGSGGGGSETPTCYGTAPNIFFDDFESGSDCWKTNTANDWSLVSDGYLDSQGFRQGTPAATALMALVGEDSWQDLRIDARVKILDWGGSADGDDIIGIFARYVSPNDFYYAGLRGDGKLHARKRLAGSNSSIGASYVVTGGWVLNTWYDVGFEIVGSEMKLYLNDFLVRTVSDTDISTGGLVGIGSVENATAVFDDVSVTLL